MKRLAWLLIAVVCTALAQVQPVDLPAQAAEKCCCCGEQDGACGMPDCAPAPSAPQAAASLQVVITRRAEAGKPARAAREFFFARFVQRPVSLPAFRASLPGASAASVPLFKAHCSFLI